MAEVIPFKQPCGGLDLETRIRNPSDYWCVGPKSHGGPAFYYWGDQRVTREEYLKYSGKADCADPAAIADRMGHLGHDDES